MTLPLFQKAFESLCQSVGEDPERQELIQTPNRMLSALKSFLQGYKLNYKELLKKPLPIHSKSQTQIILFDQIPFFSLCEHHLSPFFGTIDIAFIPHLSSVGLGNIHEYIQQRARVLALQEKLTDDILEELFDFLKPKAMCIYSTALHTCSALAKKQTKPTKLQCESFKGETHLFPLLKREKHGHQR